eukprot:7304748-Alexandrium_andersonii.AAC.1
MCYECVGPSDYSERALEFVVQLVGCQLRGGIRDGLLEGQGRLVPHLQLPLALWEQAGQDYVLHDAVAHHARDLEAGLLRGLAELLRVPLLRHDVVLAEQVLVPGLCDLHDALAGFLADGLDVVGSLPAGPELHPAVVDVHQQHVPRRQELVGDGVVGLGSLVELPEGLVRVLEAAVPPRIPTQAAVHAFG